MLGGEQPTGRIEGKPSPLRRPVAKRSAGENFWPSLVGVVAPGTGAGFEFDAGL